MITPSSVLRTVTHPWSSINHLIHQTSSQSGPAPVPAAANANTFAPTPMAPTSSAKAPFMSTMSSAAASPASAPAPANGSSPTPAAATNPTSTGSTGTTSTGSSTSDNIANAANSLASDQTTFLKLLTAQLQNQDPLSPMDTNQFTQQLVEMTGVQQQILSNQLLQQMVNQQGGVGNSVGLIGKDVKVATGAATLQGGNATWNYNLPAGAANVTYTVIDSSGNTVYQSEGTNVGSGDHTFSWNGQDLTGTQRPDGTTFGLKITATDSSGSAVASSTWLQGTVSSIQQVGGETVALVNGTQVPLNLISQID